MTAQGESAFAYRDGSLRAEEVDLAEVAERFGTPTYVYSRRSLLAGLHSYLDALAGRDALVCYAVKANANLGVLQVLAGAGAGFDIVSAGELVRARAAGARPEHMVFSGVGKTRAEIAMALAQGIACFNVESAAELEAIDSVARAQGRRAPVSLRINPDVDPRTHPYIATGLRSSKFGIDAAQALDLYRDAASRAGLAVVGIDCHIGSQITSTGPYLEAAERLFDLVDRIEAAGIPIHHVDFGGGLGIAYRPGEVVPPVRDLVRALLACADRRGHGRKRLLVEPGRSIVGEAGILLTRVQYLKSGPEHRFAVVDAGMNDLLRPALYEAWMDVVPVARRAGAAQRWDIVGPVCESADWLARDRSLALQSGDLLAVRSAGAYAMSMASNYNARPRPAEVMVDGAQAYLVRRRESLEELFAGESLLPPPRPAS